MGLKFNCPYGTENKRKGGSVYNHNPAMNRWANFKRPYGTEKQLKPVIPN
jgi:hypothetical protein